MAQRFLLAVGVLCLTASAFAQTTTDGTDFATRLRTGDFSTGTYLVDGTGVVYDQDQVTIFVNDTAIGTIPTSALEDKEGEDDKVWDPETQTFDLSKLKNKKLTFTPPTLAPGAAFGPGANPNNTDYLGLILAKLTEGKPEPTNPLDNIIIGRKMKL